MSFDRNTTEMYHLKIKFSWFSSFSFGIIQGGSYMTGTDWQLRFKIMVLKNGLKLWFKKISPGDI